MKKDTVYIDIEDDITAIIEKINNADEKIVALVPPKRSAALSSVVNLKLIHKTAQDQNKRVVLISTDKTLVSLAGGIGMYVAPNLQSAPAIPAVSPPPEELPSEIIKDDEPVTAKKAAKNSKEAKKGADVPEEVVDDLSKEESKLKKVLKVPKVPDFNRFKHRILLMVLGGVGLVALLIWAFYIAPRASIVLAGQTNRLPTEVEFTADTSLEQADFDKKLLPATSKEIKRESSESFTPTGEKDLGEKANGTVVFYNCSKEDKLSDKIRTVPGGTKITSNGLAFVTSASVQVGPSSYAGDTCTKNKPSVSVPVVAASAGENYNLSAREYTVSGFSTMTASGSDMSGGTSEVVKVVSKADIDKAKEAAIKELREGVEEELVKGFDEAMYVIKESYGEDLGDAKPSVPAGERADSASLSMNATFFILGIDRSVMEEFLRRQQEPALQLNQAIFKTGLDDAKLTKSGGKSAGKQVFTLKTDGYAGPDANIDELRSKLASKSFGEAKRELEEIPGVSEATIDLSPFWVFSIPRRTGNISITINVDESQPTEAEAAPSE